MVTKEQWQDVISAWLDQSVEIGAIDEIRDWSQSRVLRITATVGEDQQAIYVKQARLEHAKEAAVYRLAAERERFPAPLGHDTIIDSEHWLLIEQASGEQLARCQSIERYRDAVKALATFHGQSSQEHWTERIEGLERMTSRVDELAMTALAQVQARAVAGVFTELDCGLLSKVQIELAARWPTIKSELATYPESLIHGDCHSGNIFIRDEGIQFVDWGSVAIAPGLLDLAALLDVAARMKREIGSPTELLELYWANLSADARDRYGSLPRAYQVLRICRSLLELDWFSHTEDDYGQRANRELGIIAEALSRLLRDR